MTKKDRKAPTKIRDKTKTKAKTMLAEGLSQRKIADELAISKTAVHSIKKNNKDLIEKIHQDIINDNLDRIKRGIRQDIETGEDIRELQAAGDYDKDTNTVLTRIDKREEHILKSVGIFPSQTLAFQVQNIYNDNRQQVISPHIMKLLQGQMDEVEGEVVE